MNTYDDFTILRAIYHRSHAQRQTHALLDDVAGDLQLFPGRLRQACLHLRAAGLLTIAGRFLSLTPEARRIVESA
jgi:Mn-dependent DtxR family transcriptional regulator